MNLERLKEMKIDLAGIALFMLIAAGGYAMFLHEPLADAMAEHAVQENCRKAQQKLTTLQEKLLSAYRKRDAMRDKLDRLGTLSAAPDSMDELLSRLDQLAEECGVQIVQWRPIGLEEHEDYTVRVFSVQGQAEFTGLSRWFALIESGVPLLDVTHFSVGAEKTAGKTTCKFECTLKLCNGGKLKNVEMVAMTK